jgi:hypothetical protein
MFIIWGIDDNRVGTSTILILNVSNPNTITLSKNVDPNSSNNVSEKETSSGLGTDAKIGVAVGCVIAVCTIDALFGIFFINI